MNNLGVSIVIDMRVRVTDYASELCDLNYSKSKY